MALTQPSTSTSTLPPVPTATHTDNGLPVLFYARVLRDYVWDEIIQFGFKKGDVIAVTKIHDNSWWQGFVCDPTGTRFGPRVSHFLSSSVVCVGSRREAIVFRFPQALPDTGTPQSTCVLFYVKALFDYEAKSHHDFDFRAGDVIAVTDTPEKKWWRGDLVDESRRQPGRDRFLSNHVLDMEKPWETLPSSQERVYTEDGWPILFYVRASQDYQAMIDEEFDFQAGDIIAVTDTSTSVLWSGALLDETRRETGRHLFPSNYVRLI